MNDTHRQVGIAGVMTAALAVGMIGGASGVAPARAADLQFEPVRLVNDLNEGCAIADVNNDGQLDIIAGPHWFEGPMWRQHQLRHIHEIDNEFISNNGDHAFDLNGDGWVDIISATWFGEDVHWYENPGKDGLRKAQLWKEHKIIGNKGQCEGTVLEDLDGDGTPELILNHWEEARPVTVILIEPGKDGKPPRFTPVDLAPHGNDHGIALGDVDGDGRRDIVLCHGWLEAPKAGNMWKGKWTYHKAFGMDHTSVPGLVVDVNKDGRNDVLFGLAHNYGLFFIEQTGTNGNGEPTWEKHLIDKSWSQAHVLVWADLDGDGEGELITGKRWRGHRGKDPGGKEPVGLYRYTYDPKSKSWDKQTLTCDEGIGAGMQIRVADLDKDGRPDLAVAGKTGTYVLYNRGPVNAK